MAELTYTRVGDYYIPNLALDPKPAEPARDIGAYGRMRLTYLKQHRRDLYRELVTSGKLQDHLLDIENTSRKNTPSKLMREVMRPLSAAPDGAAGGKVIHTFPHQVNLNPPHS